MAGGGALNKVSKALGNKLGEHGRGWWLNKRNNVLKEITNADLGPHGDHDGWIGIGRNARSLGIDPREAKAMQRGTYGFFLPRKMSQEWIAAGGAPMDVQRGRAYYNAMFGNDYAPANALFERLYGINPTDAASGGVLGAGSSLDDLVRIRAWPEFKGQATGDLGTLVMDSATGIRPADLQEVWSRIGNEVPVTPASKFTASDVHGDQFVNMLLQEALQKKHKFAGGGALSAAAKHIERTKPWRADALELARLKRMRQNAGGIEGMYAGMGKEYDAIRAAMLGRALNDAIYAADKTFPEQSVNLLKYADPAAPSSAARGALSFRDPGYYAGAHGVPPDAVYIDDLGALRTPHVPVGRALLQRLQDETNGLPLVLESLERPETLQWYADRGFIQLPTDNLGKNPFGSRLPALILPRGALLKAKGGKVLKSGLSALKRAPAEVADPLSALAAVRMAAQLEAASPLMGLKKAQQLPAAYAGDAGALQQVQRQLSEAETGLQSPGRRKFVKQASALAARNAVPEALANAVGTAVAKKALTDAVVPAVTPDESIQALIASAIKGQFTGKKGLRAFNYLGDHIVRGDTKGKAFTTVDGVIESYANKAGIPMHDVEAFMKKNNITSIDDVVSQMAEFPARMRSVDEGYSSPIDALYVEPGDLDDLFEGISEAWKAKGKNLKKLSNEEYGNLFNELHDAWLKELRSANTGDTYYRKALGSGTEELEELLGIRQAYDDAFDVVNDALYGNTAGEVSDFLEGVAKVKR